jgi:glycolate oxidase iron-sulfur subunit
MAFYMMLHLDDDELSSCVACGLCLPHCPTFRATGEEALSPRGRIDAMRGVQWRDAPADEEFVSFMETCVQCRGCEPACPSGVPFGRLMEGTREALAGDGRITPWWQRRGLAMLGRHRTLLAGSTALALLQRVRLVPKRLGLPRLPIRRGPAVTPTTGHAAGADETEVWMFTGCVMDAWMRPTHRSTVEVLEAMGATIRVPGRGGACCGALHTHAGLTDDARRLAERVIASMPGDAHIVVNSAGCGAALKDYGHLVGTDEAAAFSARVVDVHAWVAERLDRLPPPKRHLGPVMVQDPCHLRHVQRDLVSVRQVLAHVCDPVDLADDGLCCGAGGAYSMLQPELAGEIRARKIGVIEAVSGHSGAAVVASANPGCAMHLAAAGLDVRHPMDLVAASIR